MLGAVLEGEGTTLGWPKRAGDEREDPRSTCLALQACTSARADGFDVGAIPSAVAERIIALPLPPADQAAYRAIAVTFWAREHPDFDRVGRDLTAAAVQHCLDGPVDSERLWPAPSC